MRQINDQQWLASPFFKIEYHESEAALRLKRQGFIFPLIMKLERAADAKEKLRTPVREVRDQEGKSIPFDEYFQLRLHTINNEFGYWKDTGIFIVNKV